MVAEGLSQRYLIIGDGASEHALGWKIKQDRPDAEILFSPGNAGTETIGENLPGNYLNNLEGLADIAEERRVSLTIPRQESYLAAGVVDKFQERGLRIFGCSSKAARIESSKAEALFFMEKNHIPCPRAWVYSNRKLAKVFLETFSSKDIVIKKDGLSKGKGVYLPKDRQDAVSIVDEIFDCEDKVIFQKRLSGYEISIMAFSDGENVALMLPSNDHKTIDDNPESPMTGGMGGQVWEGLVPEGMMEKIEKEIVLPTILGMKREGRPFVGVLYPGLMITQDGPKVLEFNCRWGEPETQSMMLMLESDLVSILDNCVDGCLNSDNVVFKRGAAQGVVLATPDYPLGSERFEEGQLVHESNNSGDLQIFHSRTWIDNEGKLRTSPNSRALTLAAYGSTPEEARKMVYGSIGPSGIHFEGMRYRYF